MPQLTDIYQLRRAGDYSSPRDEGAVLPVVYGDMTTGGSGGLWQAPCIDTANFVYAVAGTALLSVANGNSITVYDRDGQEIASGWTFNETHDYEGLGSIATLTFSGDQSAKEPLLVRAKGRDDGAGALIESPAAIAEDFALLAGYISAEISAPDLVKAKRICTSQSYNAAGLVVSNQSIGNTLASLLLCFLGAAQLGPTGLLRITIDAGQGAVDENDFAGIIRAHETENATVKANIENACNQASAEYAFNWYSGEYQAADDGAATKDAASQARWGDLVKAFQWPWIRASAVAQAVQAVITATFGTPPRTISLPMDSLREIPLQLGDVVLLSSRWILGSEGSPLQNQLARVQKLTGNLNKRTLDLDLLDTGLFKTFAEMLDGSWTLDGTTTLGAGRDTNNY